MPRAAPMALLAMLTLAGCTSVALPPASDLPADPGPTVPAEDGTTFEPGVMSTTARDEHETFEGCDSKDTCDFYDEEFHEYVLYDPDTAHLDVLIVPPASPDAIAETKAMKDAVLAWGQGIRAYGAPWMRSGFSMSVYVIGQDVPPQDAIQDPEIIVLGAEYNPVLLFGIGLEPKQLVCQALGQETVRAYPAHEHGDVKVLAADCTDTGFTCVAVNTNFLLGGLIYMQDLVAHEFGHCLGGGHVGDALDFKAKVGPAQDIMSYQHSDHVHCVSTLNVRVLEGVYGHLIEGSNVPRLNAGDFYRSNATAYRNILCPNP